jgi:hypothetical protein
VTDQPNRFEGWAVVEMFGHVKEVGYVTTQHFGVACLFQVDTPELPEREFVLESPEYVGSAWTPAGSKVKREASPAKSRLVGPGAIYSMTPCTEATAMKAIESFSRRPLVLLELAKDAPKFLPDLRVPEPSFDDDEDAEAYK